VVHLDVGAAMNTRFAKGLTPELLRNIPITAADPGATLKEAPKWSSVTLFLDEGDQHIVRPFSMLGVLRTKEARDEMMKEAPDDGKGVAAKTTMEEFEGVKYQRSEISLLNLVNCHLPIGDFGLYTGSEEGVKQLISAKGKILNESIAKQMRGITAPGQIKVAFDIAPVRETMLKNAGQAAATLPGLAEVPNWVKAAGISLDVDGDTLVDGTIEATDEESAAKALGLVKALLGMANGQLGAMKQQVDTLPATHPFKSLHSMGDVLTQVKVDQSGAKVTLQAPRPAGFENLPTLLVEMQKITPPRPTRPIPKKADPPSKGEGVKAEEKAKEE
jgi:hypothetical protein